MEAAKCYKLCDLPVDIDERILETQKVLEALVESDKAFSSLKGRVGQFKALLKSQ